MYPGKAIGSGSEGADSSLQEQYNKVGNAEALNCYYAHGELNPNFQRRSYWMLDPAYEHIVLVHYRDITEAPNGLGFFFGLLQLGVYASYYKGTPGDDDDEKPAKYEVQLPGNIV